MDIFRYGQIDLDGPAFRLLQLLPGEGSDIKCILYQAYLNGSNTISYTALSYVWGDRNKKRTVTVNGKKLEVTENLYSSLQHLREKGIERTLWADAICIDQSNAEERGHQVQQMGKIYSQAEEVIVWLGQGTEETDVIMDCLHLLEERSSTHPHRDWNLAQWSNFWWLHRPNPITRPRECLDRLLKRPWFKRVWILQEVANARRARIWCGTKSVKAHIFALAPSLIGVELEPHCQAVLDIMPGRLREESWWSENRTLYNLLLKFSESEATEKRDKVYALLGISSDAWDTDDLRPDYTKDIDGVVRDTSSFLARMSNVSQETVSKLLENIMRQDREVTLSGSIKIAAGNKRNGRETIDLLLRQHGSGFKVTEEVLEAAAGNEQMGRDIIDLLLQKRGSEIEVTDRVFEAAARNEESGKEVLGRLLQWHGSRMKSIEEVVKAAAGNKKSGDAIIEFIRGFQMASHKGKAAAVKFLLDNGANPNAQGGEYGQSNGLYAASEAGHDAVVKVLLDKGADPNVPGGSLPGPDFQGVVKRRREMRC